MEPGKRIILRVLNWRVVYQLFSGILFISLGIVIFVRSKGLNNFLSAGLFGSLLCAYGIYRLYMFIHMVKKAREDSK